MLSRDEIVGMCEAAIGLDSNQYPAYRRWTRAKAEALRDLALQALDRPAERTADARWIPVSERLPEGGDLVLTLSVNAHMTTKPAQAMRNSISESIKHGRIPHYTHWMPLPPAPLKEPGR